MEIVEFSLRLHIAHQTPIFFRREVVNFLHSQPGCSENSPLHATKTRLHYRKAESVDQLLHRVQTEETDYVSILATGSRSFQA
jgi:hypothetical protein